jgi:hypothetical protein
MNSSMKDKCFLAIWSIALVVFFGTAVALAGSKPSGGGGSHAPSGGGAKPSGGGARPSGGGGARPGGAGGGSHAGGAQGQNRGPGGAQGQNRGPGGGNARSGSQAGNRGGAAGGNRGGTGNTGNRGGSQAGNRGGTAGGNRGGTGNTGNRGGSQAGNRGGAAGGNRGGAAGGNHGNAGGNRGNAGGNKAAGNRAPKGSQSHVTKSGNHVQTRANGSVRSVNGHVNGHSVHVERGAHGGRRVVSEHNGRRTVAYGRHGGYSQRAFYRHGGHEYYQRTYWRGGHAYAYGYRGYGWGGYNYYGYAPAYYWGPAYYGWAYNPWASPIAYGWGWGGAPWYGFYGAYWNPYPVYPSAAFWLADYFVAASLQAAYADQQQAADDSGQLMPPTFNQASSDVIAELSTSDPLVAANLASIYPGGLRLAAAPATSSGPAMTKEIKDAIAEEIKGQIAAEKTAAANKDSAGNESGPPAALDPNIRYFVVANEEDLTDKDGNECTLTGGDVVYRTGDTPDDDHMVDATVKASRKDECATGATVGISTDDLMDMYNNLRQNMADGMKEMAAKNGKNGLPKAPDTTTTGGEIPAPTPDANVQDDLKQAQSDGDAAEADAKQPN